MDSSSPDMSLRQGLPNHDLINRQGWNAVKRTRLLLTFGSPLDKTAFIFRAQVEDNLRRHRSGPGPGPGRHPGRRPAPAEAGGKMSFQGPSLALS